jgi:hypothetical protein
MLPRILLGIIVALWCLSYQSTNFPFFGKFQGFLLDGYSLWISFSNLELIMSDLVLCLTKTCCFSFFLVFIEFVLSFLISKLTFISQISFLFATLLDYLIDWRISQGRLLIIDLLFSLYLIPYSILEYFKDLLDQC